MTTIIGIAGTKGSGKDTAAKVFKANGYEDVKFAAPIKAMLRTLLYYRGVDSVTVERMVEGDLKEVPTPYLEGKTPREAMQTLGTEWGRELIGEGLWANTAQDRWDQFKKVVVSDVRFPNEVDILHARDGDSHRIERDDHEGNGYSLHPSEQHIPSLPVKSIIDNNGSIEDMWHELSLRHNLKTFPKKGSVPVEFTITLRTVVDPDLFDDDVVTDTDLDVLQAEIDHIVDVDASFLMDTIRMGEFTLTGRLL